MTREEAIKEYVIPALRNTWNEKINKKVLEALEQEPILDKIRAEIEEEYRDESEHPYGQGLRRALQIIDKYKAESENKE